MLVGSFVVAGMAAGVAIHQAVRADANVELRLTEAAELVADALVFRHLALAATVLGVAGSGGHSNNCSAGGNRWKHALGNPTPQMDGS